LVPHDNIIIKLLRWTQPRKVTNPSISTTEASEPTRERHIAIRMSGSDEPLKQYAAPSCSEFHIWHHSGNCDTKSSFRPREGALYASMCVACPERERISFRLIRKFGLMRHSTWLALQSSYLWQAAYAKYRKLPSNFRASLRWIVLPRWEFATTVVRKAAREHVVAGPFKGMNLPLSDVSKRLLSSYVLGSAELELRCIIERLIACKYGTIVNIGAADGYYAVGFARRLPEGHIVAFEAIPELHSVIERTARLNGVADQIRIRGRCDFDGLRAELVEATAAPVLIFVDIEGFETQLLDLKLVPELRFADLLIETHDALVPKCTETIVTRLQETHRIERFVARPRTVADFPENFLPLLPKLFPRLAVDLMDERRMGIQQWLFCEASARRGRHDSNLKVGIST
jgi:hypothetical protein